MKKITSFIILLVFLFSNSAYPTESNSTDTLRVPLNSSELRERMEETQRRLSLEAAYIPGRGRELDLGSFLYTHWQYGFVDFAAPEINIEKEGQNWVIKSDRWRDWLKAMYPGIDTKIYEDRVNDLFAGQAKRDSLTVEQMFAEIVKIRKEVFPGEMDAFDAMVLNRTREMGQRAAAMLDEMFERRGGISREMLLSAIFCDFGNNGYEAVLGARETQLDKTKLQRWLEYKLPMDDIDDFIERLRKPTHYVHVAGSVNGLAADLKVFAEYLLASWGDKGSATFVAKDERVGEDATIMDIEALLETDEFIELRKLRDKGRFKIVSSGSKSPGVNFRTISGEFRSCLDEVSESKAILGIKGETNNFTSNLINYGHFRFLLSRDIETRRMMGVFWDVNETESPIPLVLRVPAGVAIADRWVKAIFATQFYRARQEFEKNTSPDYATIRKIMAENGLSFVEAAYPQALLLPAEYKDLEGEYSTVDKMRFPTLLDYARYKRQILFNGVAASIIGGDAYTGEVYSLEGDGKTPVISSIEKGAGRFKANVLVSGGIFNPSKWGIGTVRAGDVDTASGDGKRTLVSHDWVFNNIRGARVSINALYFFTPTLLSIYNRYRENRPQERVEDVNFYIDAYLNEEGYENVPLYNKAYFGVDNSGNLIFGRRQLLGGEIAIGGKSVRWEKSQVMSSSDMQVPGDEDIIVYTPMMAKSDNSVSNRDNGHNVSVGKDRINLIIINNKIKAIIKDEVLLPSIGIVVSLSEGKFIEIFGEDASKFDGRRFNGERPETSFKFDWPEGRPRPKWYLGGGTMLVMDGENLVADKNAEITNFTEEGWFNLLSMQTQETQVQDWMRGPRMILGTTKTGKMFTFSFSGRSALYSGVNFAEAVEIIKKELAENGEEIQNAINLDGGSSVAFNVKGDDGQVYTTSWPAVGPDNAEGLRRPVSGCVYFKERLNLSSLKTTPVLFLDEEVVKNPSGFKAALEQLNASQNVPVILLAQETEESLRDKLKDVSLEGVRFRTLAQLGLQDFNLDEVMSLIAGIDNIRCIPLTDSLTDAYEALKKARDQV